MKEHEVDANWKLLNLCEKNVKLNDLNQIIL